MASSSKADKKSVAIGGSAKLEPKLTILQKRNPQVFDWVQGLSRGKLTTFIYEVFDLYMQQGWLLEDDWVHPTDQKALSLIQKASGGGQHTAEEFERLEKTLLEMKAQMSILITLVQNQSVIQSGMPNMMGRMMGSPYYPPHNTQLPDFNMNNPAQYQNDQHFNNGINSHNINQNIDSNSAPKATQTQNEHVLLDSNSDKNQSSPIDNETFIVVLDDDKPDTPKANSETSTPPPIGAESGFAVY